MEALVLPARIELVAFLAAGGGLVKFWMLTGRIDLEALLEDQTTGQLSPKRFQLLALTLVGIVAIIASFDQMREDNPTSLPSDLVAAILGGNHSVCQVKRFLARMAAQTLRSCLYPPLRS